RKHVLRRRAQTHRGDLRSMAPADDLQGPASPVRPATFASESTMLMTAIVLATAVVSFGVVRAWYPRVRAAPAVPATAQPAHDAAVRVVQDVGLPGEVARAASAGRLSIVTDPAGARVEVDGLPRGVSPLVIDGLAAAEHRLTVVSDSGVAQRTITVSKDVMT